MNVMVSLSTTPMAHPPRSNPFLRSSSDAPPFPCITPSTVTCVMVVSFMGLSFLSWGLSRYDRAEARISSAFSAAGPRVSNLFTRAPRMPSRCIRSHEPIAEDPVMLVLDPLSFNCTLTEHRERLLAGGEVLENLVNAPVVEGAALIRVAVGVPSADRSVARGAARPHVGVVEHHDPCTGLESRVESVEPTRKSAQRHVAPPAAGERPVEAAFAELGERVCIHG